MPKDKDQLTPDDPDDRELLERTRGQGTGGSGQDQLPSERSAPGGTSGSSRDEDPGVG
ncbi:hypothetical protein [Iamia sp.]|uniref:hypothetical protein n=1 Tax=Iamia sp. TaxID=2722710 RepID=UPI002B58E7FA|nr:hypothetical protein [Iamia sp.]HXH56567.1 hypothetical protein [Iamia sp.]